jgi:hypothetical protein
VCCDAEVSERDGLPFTRYLVRFSTWWHYGRKNKYRPLKKSKASGNTAKRPTEAEYFLNPIAMMLTMTARVNATESHR